MNPVRLLPMLIVPLLGLNATSLQNIITFDAPGAVNTFPLGGNSGGDIVGYFSSATVPNVGFLYSASSGSFTILGIPGGEAVYPGGITNSGEIAGTYSTQTINNHFFLRLPNGQYTTFDYPATGYLGSFVSINNHGDLAGSFAPSGQDYLGFVRSADTGMYTTFRIAGASETEVFGINDSNQVVGRYETSAGHSIGFIRNADGSYVTFEVPGQPDTFQLTLPRGINSAQTVVGTDGLYPPGFLRTSDGVIYAVTVGDFATEPSAVLDGDRVMGWYSAPGQYRGFVGDFSPVPEPATLLTGFIGLMVSVRRSLRSRPHRANFV